MRRSVVGVALVGAVVLVLGCPMINNSSLPEPQPADNSFCLVCHIDFAPELIAVTHAAAGIGCERCHGPCDDHASNEDGVIAPDIMFERNQVNSVCLACHGTLPEEVHKTLAESVRAKIQPGATGPVEVCTDCHGRHRVTERRRRWNKTTRELIDPK